MNKVIGGKRYDTEKAKASGCWDNGLEYRDFNYYGEDAGEVVISDPVCVHIF